MFIIDEIWKTIDLAARSRRNKKAYNKWAAAQMAQGLPYDKRAYKKHLRRQFWGLERKK